MALKFKRYQKKPGTEENEEQVFWQYIKQTPNDLASSLFQ